MIHDLMLVSLQKVDTSPEADDQSDDEDKENEPEEEEEEDDGGGWITPSNINQVKMDSADWTSPADVRVGCLTTDFAMQVTDSSDLSQISPGSVFSLVRDSEELINLIM